MRRLRQVWNYIDMFIKTIIVLGLIFVVDAFCTSLEKYVYRYTVFPIVAVVLIFTLGFILGKDMEKNKKWKPVGIISNIMLKRRKIKNLFIFTDKPVNKEEKQKEIIDELKSGEKTHVKQFQKSDFEENKKVDEYADIYNIDIDSIVDSSMTSNYLEESKDDDVEIELIDSDDIKKEDEK